MGRIAIVEEMVQGGVRPTGTVGIGNLLQLADSFFDNGRHCVLKRRITKIDSACQWPRFTGFTPAVDLVRATGVIEYIGMVYHERGTVEKDTGFHVA
jgi:hypothetical protein